MTIVVLDGYTLNPGDLDWGPFQALGDCTVFDRTPPALVGERAAGAEVILTNKTLVGADALAALPLLRYIGVLATGTNIVDVEAATRRRIPVTNVPAYSTHSVAQLVFAHLLQHLHDVGGHAEGIRRGRWSSSLDFSYADVPLGELAGKTMGILGFGRIGHATSRIALAFGMKVIATDPSPDPAAADVRFVGLEELFRESDVLSLHAPLTERTRGIVSKERIAQMKRTAIILNTSRGPLVDEAALAEALGAGAIRGAGLDVLSSEPPSAENPLLRAPHCFITPHIAWATREARERLLVEAAENVRAYTTGTPRNVVNPEVLG